jgi:hypothetical protein
MYHALTLGLTLYSAYLTSRQPASTKFAASDAPVFFADDSCTLAVLPDHAAYRVCDNVTPHALHMGPMLTAIEKKDLLYTVPSRA